MSAYGPPKLSPLDDARRGWSKALVVAVVLVVVGVVLVPVTLFAIYELGARYCSDTTVQAISDAWLDLAHDSRTHNLTTLPQPGCDADDPTPSISQELALPPGSTAQARLDAERAALKDLGWVEHSAYPVGHARRTPTDSPSRTSV